MLNYVIITDNPKIQCGGLINFIAGTLWITCRLVVTGFWVPLLYRILSITSRTEDIMVIKINTKLIILNN